MRCRSATIAHRLGLLLVAVIAPLFARPARADAARALDVTALAGGVSVTPYLSGYEDRDGTLDLAQLRASKRAPNLKLAATRSPSLGLTRATVWLTFDARNPSDEARTFVLELGYPLIDHVTLHAVSASGQVDTRVTGDSLPFSQRELSHPHFVFRLAVPAHQRISYYLRLQTTGVIKYPLTAWTPDGFTIAQQTANTPLFMFYGAIVVLAVYSLGVYVMIRQNAYLAYALLAVTVSAIVCTLSGHTFQFFLPANPWLANRMLQLSFALAVAAGTWFAQQVLRTAAECERDAKLLGLCIPPSLAMVPIVLLVDPGLSLRLVLGVGVACAGLGAYVLVTVARRRVRQARLYVVSWYVVLVILLVEVLLHVDLLSASLITDWMLYVALAMHGVIASLALAQRVNIMREDVEKLNGQLSRNVTDLEGALLRAEDASEEARRATAAKDEFMATMSHELRTPLNTIINVPQGLLEDFPQQPAARCAACGARFLLDSGEAIDASLGCAACGEIGTLVAGTKTDYLGEPERTAHFLRRIERSGRHLLHVVNGVLDFSKIEAGHLQLDPQPTDLGALLREVVDEIGDLVANKQLRIELTIADVELACMVDPVRIKQIVINLLANAVKFSDEGSTIEVAWHAAPDADVIAVRDHGIGIAPADQERVFQRFEQVHKGNTRKYGGTGLGLPISRSLARMHGGDLTVESAPGQGSTFTLTLPRSASARRRTASGSDAAE